MLEGCEIWDVLFILVDSRLNIYVFFVFLFNGDGINDIFIVFVDVGILKIIFIKILDCWGNLVFV